jgi:hypothetical protein
MHKQTPSTIVGDCLSTIVIGSIVGAALIGFVLHGFAATLNAVGDAFRAVLGA